MWIGLRYRNPGISWRMINTEQMVLRMSLYRLNESSMSSACRVYCPFILVISRGCKNSGSLPCSLVDHLLKATWPIYKLEVQTIIKQLFSRQLVQISETPLFLDLDPAIGCLLFYNNNIYTYWVLTCIFTIILCTGIIFIFRKIKRKTKPVK